MGFLIKTKTLELYEPRILDHSQDGLLWMKLKDAPELGIIMCVCYLPPEGSSRGNSAQEFYDRQLTQLYTICDGNPTIICGDYNGRIGHKTDCNIDEIPIAGVPIDNTCNKFGDHLLDFIHDASLCLLNDRFNANNDNFTCISSRGSLVVDYLMTPRSQFRHVNDFIVTTVTEALDRYGITPNTQVKLPDHSLVSCHLSTSQNDEFEEYIVAKQSGGSQRNTHTSEMKGGTHRRHRVNALPDDLFDNERCKHALGNIITALQEEVTQQDEVDDVHDKLISTIHEEMDARVDYKDYSRGTKKRARRNKPYWNDDLAKLWKDARDSENAYLKSNGSTRERRHLLTHFKNKRNDFDKQLRLAQRKYYREQ